MVLSEPLYDLLKKYPKLCEKVLETASPLALVTAAVWLVGPRVIAGKMLHDMAKEQARNAARNVTPPPAQTVHAGAQTVPPHPAGPTVEPVPSEGAPFPKDLAGVQGWDMAEV